MIPGLVQCGFKLYQRRWFFRPSSPGRHHWVRHHQKPCSREGNNKTQMVDIVRGFDYRWRVNQPIVANKKVRGLGSIGTRGEEDAGKSVPVTFSRKDYTVNRLKPVIQSAHANGVVCWKRQYWTSVVGLAQYPRTSPRCLPDAGRPGYQQPLPVMFLLLAQVAPAGERRRDARRQ